MFKNKKGFALQQVPAVIIILVVIGIVVGLGSTVLDRMNDTQTADSYASNATLDSLEGLDDFSDFQPTIAIVIAAAVIIGIVTGALVMRRMG